MWRRLMLVLFAVVVFAQQLDSIEALKFIVDRNSDRLTRIETTMDWTIRLESAIAMLLLGLIGKAVVDGREAPQRNL